MTVRVMVSEEDLTSWITLSRGALATSCSFICRIWSPASNKPTLGPSGLTDLRRKDG